MLTLTIGVQCKSLQTTDLTRIWCTCLLNQPTEHHFASCGRTIYEQFCSHKLNIEVEIILPATEMASFVQKVEAGKIKKIRDDLTRVDVQTAKASVPAE